LKLSRAANVSGRKLSAGWTHGKLAISGFVADADIALTSASRTDICERGGRLVKLYAIRFANATRSSRPADFSLRPVPGDICNGYRM
jgi:hypothetical protein